MVPFRESHNKLRIKESADYFKSAYANIVSFP